MHSAVLLPSCGEGQQTVGRGCEGCKAQVRRIELSGKLGHLLVMLSCEGSAWVLIVGPAKYSAHLLCGYPGIHGLHGRHSLPLLASAALVRYTGTVIVFKSVHVPKLQMSKHF